MQGSRSLKYPVIGMCVFLIQSTTAHTMYGSISINDMILSNEVKIVGVGEVLDSVFDKDVRVMGCLKSSNNHYMSDIYTIGSDLSLSKDLVDGDVHITNYLKTPKLYMTNTSIKGRVIFHGRKKGKVVMDQKSELNGIENGEVE